MPEAAASASDVLAFHVHWDVLGIAAFLVLGYWYGIRRLASRWAPRGEEPVTRWQQVAWYAGVGLLFLVRGWPIHDIGEGSLFTFHMIEHMVMALVVPPLMLYGIPWWLLRRIVLPIMPVVRFLTRPIIALVFFNAVLAAIHVPAVVELMVTNETAHLAIHTVFLLSAFAMWWPVIGPIPDLPRLAPFPRMGYLFLQSLVPTVPASFMTLAGKPIYSIYEELPRLWGFDVVADQTVAGLIMKLGGGAVLWLAIAWTFFRWAAEEERLARPARPAAPVG